MFSKHCIYGIVAALLVPFAGWGQIRSATISGRISDPSHSAVANAAVTATAQETNVEISTVTNTAGEYLFPYLAAGQYTIRVSASGFKVSRVSNVAVGVAETVTADITLDLGQVSQSVEVQATAVTLQTESATKQGSVDQKLIETIPNLTQNAFQYATMQAGVTARANSADSQTTASFGVGVAARRNFSAISIGGGIPFTNDIQLDGISIQGSGWNEATVLPNPDAVQEVRTLVNNYSAEYGRGQGIISVVGRSGTNKFNGSVFDRLRNEALNANTFANNSRGLSRLPFKVNSYGGTLGGPIKKDTAFFFASYQGLRTRQGVNNYATVPDEFERVGDFSRSVVNVNGQPRRVQIFDPYSAVLTGVNTYTRTAVPNAVIPVSQRDPFALKAMSYYPKPTQPGDDVYETNNYLFRGIQEIQRNSVNSRLDYHRGRNSYYATMGVSQGTIKQPPSFGESSYPFSSVGNLSTSDNNPYIAIGDTVILSSSTVFDIRYGVARLNTEILSGHVDGAFDYSQFGIPRELQAINAYPQGPPNITVGGRYTALSTGSPGHLNQNQNQTNHHLVGSMTKTVSRWTLKFGAEYRVYLSNLFSVKGTIALGNTLPTVGDGTNTSGIGTLANFTAPTVNSMSALIGSPTADLQGWGPATFIYGVGTAGVPPASGFTRQTLAQKYGAIYSQNDWRASSKLTINLGMRWDVQPGPTDRYNKFCAFDPKAKNPYDGLGGWACPGVNGAPRNLWAAPWTNFGPRLGVAYKLSSSMVLRAGYGLNFLPTNTGFRDTAFTWGMNQFAAYTSANPLGPNPAAVPIGPYYSLAVNPIVPASNGDPKVPGNYGGTTTGAFYNGDFPTQHSHQWNIFLQKTVGANWQFSLGYAGSNNGDLMVARFPISNSPQYIPDSLLRTWREGWISSNGRTDPSTVLVRNPVQPVNGPLIPFTAALSQATVTTMIANQPYPLFLGLQSPRTIGFSSYNSLTFQVSRRVSSGLIFDAHYTWSKSLDYGNNENLTGNEFADTGGGTQGKSFNIRDLNQNYSPSYFDIPHRVVASVVYSLPFGQGKAIQITNPVLRGIASGWSLSAVATFQAGSPVLVSGASTGSINNLPDRIAGVPVEVPKDLQRWYDGKTTVTMPNGSQITPCAFCFLKYYSGAFTGKTVTTPNGTITNDLYWFGSAAPTFTDIRGNGLQNWNATLDRTFKVRERVSIQLSAQVSNILNKAQFRPGLTMSLGNQNVQAVNNGKLPIGQGTSNNFGTYGNSTFDPRQAEIVMRLRF